jgi:NAD(P)-dependent dehydrogenase (short-subunit alcohol dehydrogenase family)
MMTAGHVAIVTGANHGIGAATAEALARQGRAVGSPTPCAGRSPPGAS